MNSRSRIKSILEGTHLTSEITNFQSFDLLSLKIDTNLDFALPNNLRLGHLAENVIAESIKASLNYKLIHQGLQLIKNGKTTGELDFIIKNKDTNEISHVEFAYKFYLFDPSISNKTIDNCIGPNRNDSLKEKLDKLKLKQFPLLYSELTKPHLPNIKVESIKQKLCLLVSLYLPYKSDIKLNPDYEKGVKGYYLGYKMFLSLHKPDKLYHIPDKKNWGIEPSDNQKWCFLEEINNEINSCIEQKRSLLIWQKQKNKYSSFFITWW